MLGRILRRDVVFFAVFAVAVRPVWGEAPGAGEVPGDFDWVGASVRRGVDLDRDEQMIGAEEPDREFVAIHVERIAIALRAVR